MGEHLKLNNINGSVLSFNTDIEKPLENLRINFSPVQAGSGDPSPSNVRPITGWTGVDVKRHTAAGKNLFDINTLAKTVGNYSVTVENGVAVGSATNFYNIWGQADSNILSVIPDGQLAVTVSAYNEGNYSSADVAGLGIYFKYSDGTYSTVQFRNSDTQEKTLSGVSNSSKTVSKVYISYGNNGSNIWHITKLQIESGSEPTSYEPYLNETLPINWESAGTVYGGYVDLVSGEVVSNTNYRILNGTDDSTSNQYTNYVSFVQSEDRFGTGRRFSKYGDDAIYNVLCDSLPIYYDKTSENFPYLWVTEQGSYVFYIIIMGKLSEHPEVASNEAAIQYTSNWLKEHPVTVVWKTSPSVVTALATTPQITPLLGANNIWSSANGDIQASYYQRVYSHITDDNVLTINDGVEAPIDSLKVHFTPIQEGSGDPSPTNVRPITGWTGLEYIQCSQADNLLAPAAYTTDVNYGGIHIQILENGKHIKLYGTCNTNAALVAVYVYTDEPCYCYGVPISSFPVWKTNDGELYSDINGVELYPDGNGRIIFQIQFVSGMQYDFDFYPIFTDKPRTPVNWQSEAGTVYGGYVDLVSGEVVNNRAMRILNGTDDTTSNQFTNYSHRSSDNDRFGAGRRVLKTFDTAINEILCDSLPIYHNTTSDNFPYLYVFEENEYIYYMVIIGKLSEHPEITDSLTAVQYTSNWLKEHPVAVSWKVNDIYATTVATLTPTPLSTIKGINNIWSNANSYIEADYYKPVREKINLLRHNAIISAPHLVTSTPADIATFNTDLAAPMKECKCEFLPVQEGSGDPSPENVRAITGWTGLNVFAAPPTRLILPSSYQEFTQNGVTVKCYPSGEFVVEGVATDVVVIDLDIDPVQINTQNENIDTFYVGFKTKFDMYDLIFSLRDNNSGLLSLAPSWNSYYGQSRVNQLNDVAMSKVATRLRFVVDKDFGNFTTIPFFTKESLTNDASISWQSEAGTVYGGYVDLVKGEVVQTWASVDLGTLNWIYAPNPTNALSNTYIFYNSSTIYPLPKKLYSGIVSSYKWVNRYQDMSVDKTASYIYSTSVAIRDDDYTDAETFKSAMSGVQLVYELATPIHTPITTTTLNTLKGTNNVWSSANGPVTVKYWKH